MRAVWRGVWPKPWPLSLHEKQQLLEENNPQQRLQLVRTWIKNISLIF